MSLRLRAALLAGVVLFFGYFGLTNFAPEAIRLGSPVLPDRGMRLGLDLQGGIHWVVGAQLDAAEKHELDALRDRLQEQMAEDGVALERIDVEGGELRVQAGAETARQAVRAWADETGVLSERDGDSLRFALSSSWRQQVRERGMSQVLEVLRRRIEDPIQGIPDSVVTRQGDDRVLVQIPGGQLERGSARDLLRSTGFLEFKLVIDSEPSEELLRARYPQGLPEGTVLAFERDKATNRVLTAFLVKEKAAVTGDYLTDARMDFDRQQRPIVSFTFNTEGGRLFEELTGANIGQRLAIVLDERVYSAPSIRSRIGLRGQIEGRFTSQEAADLAVVLRSGSLSVPVTIEEERTVGPGLGADSIRRGINASILALVLVLLFSVSYYRLSGVYAGIALLANLLLLMGGMTLLGATLTMPGLAGVVLTVGMAVDSNVIIFERIREELRNGKSPRAAIATGFNKAFWTIVDANLTTLITALVLYEFGTGPVKGFAVTLGLGLVTSVFTALLITRLMFDLYPGARPVESLSI